MNINVDNDNICPAIAIFVTNKIKICFKYLPTSTKNKNFEFFHGIESIQKNNPDIKNNSNFSLIVL